MTDKQTELNSLIQAALAIESSAKRAAFLDAACGANRELRHQVEEVLNTYAAELELTPQSVPDLQVTQFRNASERELDDAARATARGPLDADQTIAIGDARPSLLSRLGSEVQFGRIALGDTSLAEDRQF